MVKTMMKKTMSYLKMVIRIAMMRAPISSAIQIKSFISKTLTMLLNS